MIHPFINFGVLFMSVVNLIFSLVRWNGMFFLTALLGFGLTAVLFQIQGDSLITLLKLALFVGYAFLSLHFTKRMLGIKN